MHKKAKSININTNNHIVEINGYKNNVYVDSIEDEKKEVIIKKKKRKRMKRMFLLNQLSKLEGCMNLLLSTDADSNKMYLMQL